jgi:hypothetical protein
VGGGGVEGDESWGGVVGVGVGGFGGGGGDGFVGEPGAEGEEGAFDVDFCFFERLLGDRISIGRWGVMCD